ncbi:MAG: hypothetical protein IJR55_02055 [Clostridia bacterium]|nr:hypothetical protein [Clostridia bacterium]
MATYYIDSLSGSDENDGKSALTPRDSLHGLKISAGDTVLFRRGSEYRNTCLFYSGDVGQPVTFSAYGDGEAPRFYGSKSAGEIYLWENVRDNVWKYKLPLKSEVGNVVYDFGEECGELVWDEESLDENGKWYFSDYGCKSLPSHDAYLLIYCDCNPAQKYRSIEICLYGERKMLCGSNVKFEGLHFLCGGVHGYAETNATNVSFSECIFEHIGGCVWDKDKKIRFGNGVEFWNGAENVKIENCDFYDIYDSCFTTQGDGDNCGEFKNIDVLSNNFSNYGMAAYEIRDKIGKNVRFEFNVCDGAGAGFSMLTDISPRMSEIYPEPMGYHIFAWRISNPTAGGQIRIMSNIFRGIPAGKKTIYADISPDAKTQILTDF